MPLMGDEALARIFLDATPDIIVAVDAGQRILLFSRSAAEAFCYSPDEVLGQPLEMLLPERYAGRHGQHIQDFAAAPEESRLIGQRLPVLGRRKDGTEVTLEGAIIKLPAAGQTIFLFIGRDISDRVRMLEELRQASRDVDASRRRIVEAQESLRRDMAQELHGKVQNRLLVAAAKLRQVAQEMGSEPAAGRRRLQEAIAIVDDVGQREVRMIARQLHPLIGSAGLLPLLYQLLASFQESFRVDLRIPDHEWAVRTLAGPSLPPAVMMAVYRVVEESLVNVRKYAQARSARVTIGPLDDGGVEVVVEDDGMGVDLERARTGLGVLMMQDYCRSLGGKLELTRLPIGGTEVRAIFPVMQGRVAN